MSEDKPTIGHAGWSPDFVAKPKFVTAAQFSARQEARIKELERQRDALLKAAKEALAEVEHLRENDKGLATKFPDTYPGGNIAGAVDETFRRVLITLENLRAAVAAAEGGK